MREFKFRVWSKSDNKFIFAETESNDGHGITLDGIFSFCSESHFGFNYSPEDFTIQQWTGLTDKNGKEIWEGDICLLDNSEFIQDDGTPEENDLAPVTYNKKYGAFDYEPSVESLGEVASELKVVGNVFENPELCK